MTTAPATTIAVPAINLEELHYLGAYLASYTDLITDLLTKIVVGMPTRHHDNVITMGYLLTDLKAAANTVQEITAPLITTIAEPATTTAETTEADELHEELLDGMIDELPHLISLLQAASDQLSSYQVTPVQHQVAAWLVLDTMKKMKFIYSSLTNGEQWVKNE